MQPLGDLGQFDFVWLRFVLEYFRSKSQDIVQNAATILKPGGILCLIDLDCNCLRFFGLGERLERAVYGIMAALEKNTDFDPYVGVKLYSHLYDIGFQDIDVHIASHNLTFGELGDITKFNYTRKVEVAARNSGYNFEEFPGGFDEFFEDFKRIAIISGPGNKDGVLFPEKINDLYVRLDRPIGNDIGSIWVSYSPDLINWGRSELVISPRPRFWDSFRIGASVPPIRTSHGWLEIYHGLKMTPTGPIYRVGTVMLDIDNPATVLGRCFAPVLSPREEYERIGDVGNVVFASGAIVEPDGQVKLYYGAADTSICLATAHIDDLVQSCFQDADLPSAALTRQTA